MTKEKRIKTVVESIAKNYKPEKIFLFGSFAWGKPKKDSDIDILVIKKSKQTPRKIAQKIDQSLFDRDFPLDILVYSPEYFNKRMSLGDYFTKKIVSKGKLLYESKK